MDLQNDHLKRKNVHHVHSYVLFHSGLLLLFSSNWTSQWLHLSGSWFFIDFACISVYSRGQFESMFFLFHHIHRRNYLTINLLKILEIEANIIILQLLLVFETSLTINYLPWYKITFSNVLLWSLPDSSPRKFHPIKPCKFS